LICLECRHRAEPDRETLEAELGAEAAEAYTQVIPILRACYSVVLYCKAYKAIVVGNPGNTAQSRLECEGFEAVG